MTDIRKSDAQLQGFRLQEPESDAEAPPEDWGPGDLGQQYIEYGTGNAAFVLFITIAIVAAILVLMGKI